MTTIRNDFVDLPDLVATPPAPDAGITRLSVQDGHLYVQDEQGGVRRATPTTDEQQMLAGLCQPSDDIVDVGTSYVLGGDWPHIKKIRCNAGTDVAGVAKFDADGNITDIRAFGTGLIIPNPELSLERSPYDGKLTMFGQTSYGGGSGLTEPDYTGRFVKLNDDLTVADGHHSITPAMYTSFYACRQLADGRYAIAYSGTALYDGTPVNRYFGIMDENWQMDESFTPTFNGNVLAFEQQPDGKFIVVGTFNQVNGVSRPIIARLNEDGTLDTTFVSTASTSNFTQLRLLENGKIMVAGPFTSYNGNSTIAKYICRINPDGSLDTSYDLVSKISNLGAVINTAYPYHLVELQPDGGVLMYAPNISVIGHENDMTRIIKVLPDGNIDMSVAFPYNVWGGSGMNTYSTSSVHLRPDGTILFCNSGNTTFNGQPISRAVILDPTEPRLVKDLDIWSVMAATKVSALNCIVEEPDGGFYAAGIFRAIGDTNTIIAFGDLQEGQPYILYNAGTSNPRTATFLGLATWVGSVGGLATAANKDTIFQFMKINGKVIGQKLGEVTL